MSERERTNTFVMINDLIVIEKKKTIVIVLLQTTTKRILESGTI
jgi:hypothetical protein